ncbi:GerMN domain-containing protein [Metabacillus bambusae]|uniref:GerMN domain-containing protein n=1 Tax=Metabacillus bambusae TaxID=2795218 RepID=A0ABS3NA13_9BACI|nr:GerMN domain-containing protein [Metabacillus bambusae]MBO1515082.1 GerMN domain-containing protein [Metabacillus bambusae]
MSKFNKQIAITVIASSMLLSGCGLFNAEQATKEIDPPQDVTFKEEGEQLDSKGKVVDVKGEEAAKKVTSQLYLIDKNGFVVPYSMNLPETKSVAKQALEYLVEGGPVSNILPNGFKAVLPQDTQVLGVDIKNGVAVADFSKEFNAYKKEDEAKILQAITWTLTQFDSVEKVKIWVNGHEQKEMPVNGTPIQDGVTRESGINLDSSDVVDITNTHPLTVYYTAESDGQQYFVPVTKRVSNTETDSIVSAVEELVDGPTASTGLISDFQNGVELLSAPKYEDGKVTLDFNESIYGSSDEEQKIISSNVLQSLVLTLTEQQGIESVAVTVNGKAELINENGEKLTEPVTRPAKVNTGSF